MQTNAKQCKHVMNNQLFEGGAQRSYISNFRRKFTETIDLFTTFIRKTKLDEHVRRHKGEKRFSCLVCNKTYSGSYDLRKHLKNIHPSIGKNIIPEMPLTPQLISSINIFFQGHFR